MDLRDPAHPVAPSPPRRPGSRTCPHTRDERSATLDERTDGREIESEGSRRDAVEDGRQKGKDEKTFEHKFCFNSSVKYARTP